MGLIVVSGLFTLAGVGLLLFARGDRPLGALVVAFFGGCLLVGVARRGSDRAHPTRLVGGLLMGLGCGLAAWGLLTDEMASTWVPELAMVVVALVGAVFFGGGSTLLLVRSLRGDTPPPA